MSEPLEELRAQRDLIQKHLDWLDAQIEQTRGSTSQASSSTEPSATEDRLEGSTSRGSSPEAPKAPAVTTETAPSTNLDELTPPPSNGSDVKRAQIGCLAIFAVGTLLFLFLLFGLPYLVD